MLDLIILILLIAGFVTGARRGLIVQLIHMVGFIIALIVAYTYYKPLADKFVLWIPFPAVTSRVHIYDSSRDFGSRSNVLPYYRIHTDIYGS